jgi:hypothetical protein
MLDESQHRPASSAPQACRIALVSLLRPASIATSGYHSTRVFAPSRLAALAHNLARRTLKSFLITGPTASTCARLAAVRHDTIRIFLTVQIARREHHCFHWKHDDYSLNQHFPILVVHLTLQPGHCGIRSHLQCVRKVQSSAVNTIDQLCIQLMSLTAIDLRQATAAVPGFGDDFAALLVRGGNNCERSQQEGDSEPYRRVSEMLTRTLSEKPSMDRDSTGSLAQTCGQTQILQAQDEVHHQRGICRG